VNSRSLDVPQIERTSPRYTERPAGEASKGGPDYIDVSGMLGRQPSETDQRLDRGGLEVANKAGPPLRPRKGVYTRQDRSLDEISDRAGNRTPVGVLGFCEPPQRDEIYYDRRPDLETDDRLTALAAGPRPAHARRGGRELFW
jgi:hypothetical protein